MVMICEIKAWYQRKIAVIRGLEYETVIPSDEHVCFMGIETTNQIYWLVVSQTCLIFQNIWDNPSYWLFFFRGVETTKHIRSTMISSWFPPITSDYIPIVAPLKLVPNTGLSVHQIPVGYDMFPCQRARILVTLHHFQTKPNIIYQVDYYIYIHM